MICYENMLETVLMLKYEENLLFENLRLNYKL